VSPVIGVTGATGEVGGRVARRLANRGAEQRLVVRNLGRAPQLDGANARSASGYDARDEMAAALDGVTTLLLIPAEEHPDRIEQHKTAVDAATDAGVRHLVYLSFVSASPESRFTLARHHWATEQHIRSKEIDFTFLRMSMYMDFLPFMAGPSGVIRGPAGDGRVGFVLRDDLADVATEVLLAPAENRGVTHEVTGATSVSLAEAAETMANVSDKPIRYQEETVEQAWESRRPSGAPDWEIEGWISSYLAIASGELDIVSDAVERVAGHPPASLEEYLRGDPAALEHVGG
jgi:NAD(P)H dehydrogenase (quinone)